MLETRRIRGHLAAGAVALAVLLTPTWSAATLDVTATTAVTASLSISPDTITLKQGDEWRSTVTLSLPDGFGTTAELRAAGLPRGVGATSGPFSVAGTTGTTTVTFTADANAELGGATVTFTATSGSSTVDTLVALTVVGTTTGSQTSGSGGSSGSKGGCASSGFGSPTDLGVLGLGVAVLARLRRRTRGVRTRRQEP